MYARSKRSWLTLALLGAAALVVFVSSAEARPGMLDPSFGSGGIVTTAIGKNSLAEALVLQPDGKLVAAGYSYDTSQASEVLALARYNPNGALDTSFGSGGVVTTPIGSHVAEAFALLLQPDGKLVAGGY